jgi:hypothetical protein
VIFGAGNKIIIVTLASLKESTSRKPHYPSYPSLVPRVNYLSRLPTLPFLKKIRYHAYHWVKCYNGLFVCLQIYLLLLRSTNKCPKKASRSRVSLFIRPKSYRNPFIPLSNSTLVLSLDALALGKYLRSLQKIRYAKYFWVNVTTVILYVCRLFYMR